MPCMMSLKEAYHLRSKLLKHLISDQVISINSLNEMIRLFPYLGSDALNKPSPISSQTLSSANHHLRQNGMVWYVLNVCHAKDYVIITCSVSNLVSFKAVATRNWQ